eukprot:TRINITY_DN72_c0_g1_i4.p1 TRINITY_DN72_c0_g1~~TRINITY_DN72_c0_g1_i4.p1  ORF type:complete len:493 (-),score=265.82 TRINITY_DN72_c0_g1_i4:32-1510(-)
MCIRDRYQRRVHGDRINKSRMQAKTLIIIAFIAVAACAIRIDDFNDNEKRSKAFQEAREKLSNRTQEFANKTREGLEKLKEKLDEAHVRERLQKKIQDDINFTLDSFEKTKKKLQDGVKLSQDYFEKWKKAAQDKPENHLEAAEIEEFLEENEFIRLDGFLKDVKDKVKPDFEEKAKEAIQKEIEKRTHNTHIPGLKLEEVEAELPDEFDQTEFLKIKIPGGVKDKLKALKDQSRQQLAQKAKDALKNEINKRTGGKGLPVNLPLEQFDEEDSIEPLELLKIKPGKIGDQIGNLKNLKDKLRGDITNKAKDALKNEINKRTGGKGLPVNLPLEQFDEEDSIEPLELLKIKPGKIGDQIGNLKNLKDKLRGDITNKAKDALKNEINKRTGGKGLPTGNLPLEQEGFQTQLHTRQTSQHEFKNILLRNSVVVVYFLILRSARFLLFSYNIIIIIIIMSSKKEYGLCILYHLCMIFSSSPRIAPNRLKIVKFNIG